MSQIHLHHVNWAADTGLRYYEVGGPVDEDADLGVEHPVDVRVQMVEQAVKGELVEVLDWP